MKAHYIYRASLAVMLCFFVGTAALASTPMNLNTALQTALENNPELASARFVVQAASKVIRRQYFLSDPMFGVERAQVGSDQMNAWMISQELMFPTKYLTMGAMQRTRAAQNEQKFRQASLSVRAKVITAYFKVFTLGRVLALLEAHLDRAREIARTVETRRATGAVPQQDEMKAHMEETRVNAALVMAREELAMAEADMLLVVAHSHEIAITSEELQAPKLSVAIHSLLEHPWEKAPPLQLAALETELMQAEKNLALMSFLPDFKFTYTRPYGEMASRGETIFKLEATVPLWFLMRQTAQVSAARSLVQSSEKMLAQAGNEQKATLRSLVARIQARNTLLKIDETSLIPQATSTLNSSLAAYRAGRVNLMELLDSQRSLYDIRINYYRTLVEYVTSITEAEALLGRSICDLPFPSLQESP